MDPDLCLLLPCASIFLSINSATPYPPNYRIYRDVRFIGGSQIKARCFFHGRLNRCTLYYRFKKLVQTNR